MTQLDKATQQNASASEELAATSEELSGQAGQLQQAVAYFKLNNKGASSAGMSSGRPAQRPQTARKAVGGQKLAQLDDDFNEDEFQKF
jgi:methyl-accepting chemotaxis protein